MVSFEDPSDQEEPLDPATQRVQARLKRLLLISGLTMGLGLVAVFLALLYRIGVFDDSSGPAYADAIVLSKSEKVIATQFLRDRLSVHVRTEDGEALIVFDTATGERLATIEIRREP
ncbi:MAG: DUF6476 family protein [Pseudomonadota bacterium]